MAARNQASQNYIWKKKLDPETYAELEREGTGRNGVSVQVHVSPYDVPEEVEGLQLEEEGIFRIKFHYLDDDEPSRPAFTKDFLTVQTGKNSGRIASVDIKLGDQEPNWIALVLKELESLDENEQAQVQTLNMAATLKAFKALAAEFGSGQPGLRPAPA